MPSLKNDSATIFRNVGNRLPSDRNSELNPQIVILTGERNRMELQSGAPARVS